MSDDTGLDVEQIGMSENTGLDVERICAVMRPQARALLHSISFQASTGSTQSDALAAPTPMRGAAVYIADQQTSGQGRRGRAWISPPAANLYLTATRCFARPMSALSGLSVVTGIAIAESLRESGFAQVGVKWPNDLVAEGRKLGGVLIQLRAGTDSGAEAVIGIGLNVAMPALSAQQIDQPWCDLSQLALATVPRNQLVSRLLDHLLPALQLFEDESMAPFLARWTAVDALAGKTVRMTQSVGICEGIAAGITDAGALRVRTGAGEMNFQGSEVSVRQV